MLAKDIPKDKKAINMWNMIKIQVRRVIMDISDHTINLILFGQLYFASTISLKLKNRMTTTSTQWPWITHTLTDNGEPSWLNNRVRIPKSLSFFKAKYFWAVVWLRLMSTSDDANLDPQRVVLVASFIEGLKINFC